MQFNREMNNIIASNMKEGIRPSLMLHACCAPCASTCMDRVRDGFDTSVYFYNPNITSASEYELRLDELRRLIGIYNDMQDRGELALVPGIYDPREFTEIARGYEECPERGERCFRCYRLRLYNTALAALEGGFDYFTTTLTLSPLKDVNKLNEIGFAVAKELADSYGDKRKTPLWLPSDFKKEGGYQKSIELSKEYNLYRQNYCGCIYSNMVK